MLNITRRARFSAGHRYYLDHLSPAENRALFGLCALPHGHGHDYVADITVRGRLVPETGMVVNITDLKPIIQQQILDRFDGEFLTRDHPALAGRIPSTEGLCRTLFESVDAGMRDAELPATLIALRLQESRSLWATARTEQEEVMVTLTRTYEFAAAHRLHAAGLSEAENAAVFGKCNNAYGHGHNYLLEVTIGGDPDPLTGMVCDLAELDRVVNAEVVERYDHHHLNLDLDEFRALNPTSENLVRVIWDRLQSALPSDMLRRLVLHETERNSFAYEGPCP